MKKEWKEKLLLVVIGVGLYAGLMNLNVVIHCIKDLLSLLMPLIVGCALAFILNIPMRGIERFFTRQLDKRGRTANRSALRVISLLLTLGLVIVLLTAMIMLIVPTLVPTVQSIYSKWLETYPKWVALLESYNINLNTDGLTELFSNLDLNKVLSGLSGGTGTVLQKVMGAASTTVSVVGTVAIALVIAIYLLLEKEVLSRQMKKLLTAYLGPKTAARICSVGALIDQKYSSFLSGQCIEACVLGGLIFLSFCIFRLPYAGLIGMLTGLTSFLPYVGAFISCFVGALLILMVDPFKALLSIAVYQVAQFIENQFIYPRVVGSSVGLSPLWTLLAVIIGGNLFGLPGMIFFIPLCSVLQELLRRQVNSRLSQKDQPEKPSDS